MAKSNDPFSTPSESGADIRTTENELSLIWPREHFTGDKTIKTEYNDAADPVRADFVALTGENAGEIEEDVLIFQGTLVGRLKRLAKKNFRVDDAEGDADRPDLTPMLVRLRRGDAPVNKRTGKPEEDKAPWFFEAPTEEDKDIARKWIAENNKPADPFA